MSDVREVLVKVGCVRVSRLSNLKDEESNLPCPIARIPAKNNWAEAKRATTDQAEGLQKTSYVAQGWKIMLQQNLWVEKGLVYGAMGKVIDSLYDS